MATILFADHALFGNVSMNPVRICFAGLMFFAYCLVSQCAGQNLEEKTSDAVTACSIFGAASSNTKAWSCGDFLLRDHTSFDNVRPNQTGEPFGVTVEDIVYRRVIFNIQKGQYAFLSFRKVRALDIGNDKLSGPESEEDIEVKGWCINEQTGKFLQFNETGYVTEFERKDLPEDIEGLLFKIQFPEVKGFWLSQSLDTPIASFENMIESRTLGKHFSSSNSGSAHEIVEFKMIRDELGEKNASHYETFRFDSHSLMPVSYNARIELKDEIVKGPTGKYGWTEYDGIYVPVFYKFKRGTTLVVNNKHQNGLSYRDLDFHWFSFNNSEALPKGILDASCFKNREAFMKFVDPILANANSLLDGPKAVEGELLNGSKTDKSGVPDIP
jgi:hypothetical protein